MTAHEIEVWRLAQCLDDTMQYSKGTPMVTDAQWKDIVENIHQESYKAYEYLVMRFDADLANTKPCTYCNVDDHAILECRLAQVEAASMRSEREDER